MSEKLKEVAAFLLGEGALDGYWYGETPEGAGPYWWREHLREALTREQDAHDYAVNDGLLEVFDDAGSCIASFRIAAPTVEARPGGDDGREG